MKLYAALATLLFATNLSAQSFTCDQGEPSSFTLETIADLSEVPDVTKAQVEISKFSPDKNNQIQLDVCVDGDVAEFKTLHILDQGQRYTATKVVSVENLSQALFGDIANFSLVVDLDSNGLVYELKGLSKDGGTAISAMPLNGEEAVDNRVLVGNLAFGEAEFANKTNTKCLAEETEREESFKVVDATITGLVCTKITADRSTSIRFVEATQVDVIDGQEFRHVFAKEDFAPKGAFRYNWTHHNLSDTLWIKTAEGVYQAKRGPGSLPPADGGNGEAKEKDSAKPVRHSIGWVPMGIAQRVTYVNGTEKLARDNDALSILAVDNK